ncbi:Cellulose synthase-like protein D1 [Sesamum alatum]|uniref:Cellulose synthase-like protein D1 n=1 Tax=Sesamum alatum TaxID=300844 RepID=A0AAE1Y1Y1_9LAMI|nr:Cellulose synthase-like protein D1 [Sesamum alatum]
MIAQIVYTVWHISNPNRNAMWLLILTYSQRKIQDALSLDLPGVDVFVTIIDPDREPPIVSANTILSAIAVDYPVEKVSIYLLDDGGSILTFEAMAEAVKFAEHNIEPRNPESYFNLKKDPIKDKKQPDFVKDRQWIKREYAEFKVRINGLPANIRKRRERHNKEEEFKERKTIMDKNDGALPPTKIEVTKATSMADGTHWPGTWNDSTTIIQRETIPRFYR